MKLKYVALILSAVTFSQATLAAAPLCRSVLRSFTQEQIDVAIEDFTRLTIQADETQVAGDRTVMAQTLRATQRSKETELINTLGISRQELKQLVIARNSIANKKINHDRETQQRQRSEQSKLVQDFKLEKHFESVFKKTTDSFKLVANSTKLYAGKTLVSLQDGSIQSLPTEMISMLPDSMFTKNRILNTRTDVTVANFVTGKSTTLETFYSHSQTIEAADRSSIVVTQALSKGRFHYQQIDKHGNLLREGSIEGGAFLQYAGQNIWILKRDQGVVAVFNPNTNKLNTLDAKIEGDVMPLSHNKVAFYDSSKIYVLDLSTGQIISKKFDDLSSTTSIAHSDENYIWITRNKPAPSYDLYIQKFDVRTLEQIPDSSLENGASFTIETVSKLGSVLKTSTLENTGVYHNDLTTPIFKISEAYDITKFLEITPILSEDGTTLVIVGFSGSYQDLKSFVDVWKIK